MTITLSGMDTAKVVFQVHGVDDADLLAVLQEKLGYKETEYLQADDVRGYGFKNTEAGSVVDELRRGPFGLEMPTFNNELEKILEESQQIEQALPQAPDAAS